MNKASCCCWIPIRLIKRSYREQCIMICSEKPLGCGSPRCNNRKSNSFKYIPMRILAPECAGCNPWASTCVSVLKSVLPTQSICNSKKGCMAPYHRERGRLTPRATKATMPWSSVKHSIKHWFLEKSSM